MALSKNEWEDEMKADEAADKADDKATAKHEYMMRSDDDIDYQIDYLDRFSNIRDALNALKSQCKMYDLDFDTYLGIFKDEI